MPRKTDSNNPADWLWIAETDLSVVRLGVDRDDPDWPRLRAQLVQVATLLQPAKSRLPA